MHPQSLLVTEMRAGKPLGQWHGAPLRRHMPIKYGYKQIKRIGLIAYTDMRPDDYWTKLGSRLVRGAIVFFILFSAILISKAAARSKGGPLCRFPAVFRCLKSAVATAFSSAFPPMSSILL